MIRSIFPVIPDRLPEELDEVEESVSLPLLYATTAAPGSELCLSLDWLCKSNAALDAREDRLDLESDRRLLPALASNPPLLELPELLMDCLRSLRPRVVAVPCSDWPWTATPVPPVLLPVLPFLFNCD